MTWGRRKRKGIWGLSACRMWGERCFCCHPHHRTTEHLSVSGSSISQSWGRPEPLRGGHRAGLRVWASQRAALDSAEASCPQNRPGRVFHNRCLSIVPAATGRHLCRNVCSLLEAKAGAVFHFREVGPPEDSAGNTAFALESGGSGPLETDSEKHSIQTNSGTKWSVNKWIHINGHMKSELGHYGINTTALQILRTVCCLKYQALSMQLGRPTNHCPRAWGNSPWVPT